MCDDGKPITYVNDIVYVYTYMYQLMFSTTNQLMLEIYKRPQQKAIICYFTTSFVMANKL